MSDKPLRPVIYAAFPSYGPVQGQSARQFWGRAITPDSPYADWDLTADDYGGSLLADGFNVHWKNALNLQLAGQPVARFVMCHSDISPENDWMTKLLRELDEHEADVVSAVSPIKDGRGLASTAIDDAKDPWEVYKRLTMTEVHSLPETFSAADCGFADRHLLVNTGCWVADFTKPWRWKVHFQIYDRIVFAHHDGTIMSNSEYVPGMQGSFQNQVMSEDWDFSRQLGKLGCKVLATRKVKLTHWGQFPFPNSDGAWGAWQEDENLRKKFDPTNADVPDIAGWLKKEEGRLLERLATKKNVLEIGAYKGLATVWMGRKASSVVAVDTFDGRGLSAPGVVTDTYAEFMRNIHRYGLTDVVKPIKGLSTEVELPEDFFDLVFIDGSHDYDSVQADIRVAHHAMSLDGLIAFHDYSDDHPDVIKAVDELLALGWEKVEQVCRIMVIRMKEYCNG